MVGQTVVAPNNNQSLCPYLPLALTWRETAIAMTSGFLQTANIGESYWAYPGAGAAGVVLMSTREALFLVAGNAITISAD